MEKFRASGTLQLLTLSESMDVGAEVVLTLLPIHQLTKSVHIAIALLVAIVGFIRQIHLHAALHALRNAVRHDAL